MHSQAYLRAHVAKDAADEILCVEGVQRDLQKKKKDELCGRDLAQERAKTDHACGRAEQPFDQALDGDGDALDGVKAGREGSVLQPWHVL
jgi:hypothetical protein